MTTRRAVCAEGHHCRSGFGNKLALASSADDGCASARRVRCPRSSQLISKTMCADLQQSIAAPPKHCCLNSHACPGHCAIFGLARGTPSSGTLFHCSALPRWHLLQRQILRHASRLARSLTHSPFRLMACCVRVASVLFSHASGITQSDMYPSST